MTTSRRAPLAGRLRTRRVLVAISLLGLAAAILAPTFVAPPQVALEERGGSAYRLVARSADVDVRSLPQLGSGVPTKDRDKTDERSAPKVGLQGPQAYAAVGSGGPAGPAAAAPGPDTSFEGMHFSESCTGGQCGNGHPPDTNGDVGPNHYIQVINTAVAIYDKDTGDQVAAFTFDSLMSQGEFGNLCDTDNFGDPVVLYDTFADRWILTDFAFQVDGGGNVVSPPGAYQCFAVSKTGDPVSGGWWFASIHVADALHDYPKLGVWPDGIYMSANMFDFAAGGAFQSSRVWAINKSQLYAGQDPQVVQFDAPAKTGQCPVFTLLPSNARAQAGTPPAGRENLFSSVWCYTARVRVWKFHVDWANTANSTFTGPFDSTTATTWASPPAAVPSLTGNALETLGIRLMMQNQYSNIGGVESLWNAHTVAGSGVAQSAVRWYQVPVTGGVVGNALQAGTWNPDAANRFMPSVAVDRVGDMALGYNVSGSSMYPAIRYAGRLAGDPANAITQTEQSLIEGGGTQVGNCGVSACQRWGDYAAMTLDPDGCTFWYTNEYYAANGLDHHTRIGSFSFPSCVDAPPPTPSPSVSATPIPTAPPIPTPSPTPTPNFSLTASPASLTAAQGSSRTSTVTISRTNFAGPVTLGVTGLPAGVTASFSPNPATGTSSLLTVTTSNCGTATPRGTFNLTVTGTGSAMTRTTGVSLAVTNTPPAITGPASSLYAGSAVTSTTARVRTAWSGCDADGIASYQLQRQVNGGTWTSVTLASATTTSINQTLTKGSTYRFRVRATDKAGAVSSYVYGSAFKVAVLDQTTSSLVWAGTWPTTTSTSYYGGTTRSSTAAKASSSYGFTGSGIAWVAARGPTRGSASVYVDGVLKATVNLNATTVTTRAVVYAIGWPASGAHTIKVVVVGTAGHARVDVDAFARLGPP